MKSVLSGIIAIILSGVCAFAQESTPLSDSLAASREEFRESRFGIFIHWGVSSMLGSGEWVMQNRNINYKEYSKLAGGFCPEGFDAEGWVKAFKDAGAKYICITSRHHDGFSIFDTSHSDFDIVDATPFGRDALKEIADACHRHGVRLHFYYSLIDWGREDAPRGTTGKGTGRPDDTSDYDSYFEFMKSQITELLTNYGPVGAIWFDGDWDMPSDFDWRYDELYSLIHRLQPACLVGNNHHSSPKKGEDIQIFERDLPGENTAGYSAGQKIADLPLETCQTMSSSWGYSITDTNFKTTDELIKYLVGAAGRDGNLLLNIGPRPDGKLPEQAIDRLKGIGCWMGKYGFTIYGTRGGEMQPRDWGVLTRKDDKIYVHILNLKDNSLFVPVTGEKIVSARCINNGTDIKYRQDSDGVLLKLGGIPQEPDHIIELTIKNNTK